VAVDGTDFQARKINMQLPRPHSKAIQNPHKQHVRQAGETARESLRSLNEIYSETRSSTTPCPGTRAWKLLGNVPRSLAVQMSRAFTLALKPNS